MEFSDDRVENRPFKVAPSAFRYLTVKYWTPGVGYGISEYLVLRYSIVCCFRFEARFEGASSHLKTNALTVWCWRGYTSGDALEPLWTASSVAMDLRFRRFYDRGDLPVQVRSERPPLFTCELDA